LEKTRVLVSLAPSCDTNSFLKQYLQASGFTDFALTLYNNKLTAVNQDPEPIQALSVDDHISTENGIILRPPSLRLFDTDPVNMPAFSQDHRILGHCRQPKFIVMLANRVRETSWMYIF
jgi:hypothetical protein